VQFLTMAALQVLHSAAHLALPPGALVVAPSGAFALVGTLLAYLVVAALFFALGERLRRGDYVAWMLQLGFAALLLLVGVATLVRVVGDIQHGQRPAIASAVVLLAVNPVAVWLLAQPRTRAWFRAISPQAASARHGGRWLAEIAACALVGGVAVALGL
jgi:hypothetical protein